MNTMTLTPTISKCLSFFVFHLCIKYELTRAFKTFRFITLKQNVGRMFYYDLHI